MLCLITVKGGGGGHGRPAKDRTGTVESFLVDNSVFYGAVLSHLRDCDKCDPVEVLRTYLERRKTVQKFDGQTSGTLVALALKYDKLFQKRGLDGKDVVDEILWRSCEPDTLTAHMPRIGVKGVARGLLLALNGDSSKWGRAAKLRDWALLKSAIRDPKVRMVADLVESTGSWTEDFEELLKVAEVMLS